MTRTPILTLPPEGSLEVLQAMQAFLPDEWQRWSACCEAQDLLRQQSAVPPGGRRWPETDPRRVAANRTERQVRLRAVQDNVATAREQLLTALLERLRAGALVAYAVPASTSNEYQLIPRRAWERLQITSLRKSTVAGVPTGSIKVVICRANCEDGQRRSSGRPPAEARPLIEAEYWRRQKSGEALNGVHREASELIRIVKLKAPGVQLPQEQAVAKWIRKEMKNCE